MGKAKDPIFGGFSGRMGNVVGCLRHGKYYLRTLPEKVNQPDTPKQMAQRMRFRLVQEYLAPFSEFLRIGFGGFAAGRSAYSAALSYNLKQAVAGDYPDLTVDPARVLLSQGLLLAPQAPSLTVEDGRLRLGWQPVADGNPGDSVITLAFCPALRHAVWTFNTAKRKDGVAWMELATGWQNHEVTGYISFYDNRILGGSIKPELISASCFAGTVTFAGG